MANLAIGEDAVGGERFGACEYNDLKNHWRMADPRTNLTGVVPGMIASDADDDKLYHYGAAAWEEVLQLTRSAGATPLFTNLRLSALTDGYLPYHVSDAAGLANSVMFTDGNNIGIGQTSFGTNAQKVLALGTGVAPTSSPADCFQMYSADFAAGNACPYFRTENGTIIGLNQSLLTTASPEFPTVKLTNLTDGYIPYHVSDASGLANSGIYWDSVNSRVGLGTASPGAKLDITGAVADWGGAALRLTGTGVRTYGMYIDTAGTWIFDDVTGVATRIAIQSDGNIGIGTTTPDFLLETHKAAQATSVNFANQHTGLNQGIPATSGTTQNGILRLGVGTAYGEVLDIGINVATNSYAWLQATSWANLGVYFNLVLNPNGGNVGIGQTSFGTNATKTLALGSGVAPESSPADCFQMFSKDTAGAAGKAGMHIRVENAPAAADLLIVPGVCYKTDTGDPAYNFEGMICINTYDNTLKVYAEGGWRQVATW